MESPKSVGLINVIASKDQSTVINPTELSHYGVLQCHL